MDERALLGRLIAYDHWANGETLASIERAAKPSPRALGLMNHVLATEAGWLQRMGHDAGFSGFWPGDDVAGLRRILPARLEAFLADAHLSDLARTIRYVNSKGEAWTSTVGDVLMHLVVHSAYHRGQIASDLRASGAEPASTDFIHATRSGLVR